jgi:hypothetical protein
MDIRRRKFQLLEEVEKLKSKALQNPFKALPEPKAYDSPASQLK